MSGREVQTSAKTAERPSVIESFREAEVRCISLQCDSQQNTVAFAMLEVSGGGYFVWRVPSCPRCRKTHRHGAGGPDVDPRRLLGPRTLYCGDYYTLVDGAPLRTAALVEQRDRHKAKSV